MRQDTIVSATVLEYQRENSSHSKESKKNSKESMKSKAVSRKTMLIRDHRSRPYSPGTDARFETIEKVMIPRLQYEL
jgi:hypothetical protein